MSNESTNTADQPTSTDPAPGGAPTIGQALMPRPRFDPATNEIVIPTPFDGGFLRFDPAAKALNREQMAVLGPARIKPDYDPAYVAAFLADCHARQLDPWSGEVYLMRYQSADGPLYVRHIGIYGFLRKAEESGDYEGMDQVLYQGPGDDKWVEVWKYRDEPPYAAKVTSYRRGKRPQPVVALYDEYAPLVAECIKERQRDGSIKKTYTGREVPAPMWQPAGRGGKATVMLAKCDRASSLRLLFPRRFGGFYEPAELEKTVVAQARGYNDDSETAQARRAAYADAQRTVDGADLGVTVRETITVTGPDAPAVDDASVNVGGRELAESEARRLLLAELDAQARLLGYDRDRLTARWSAARDGAHFEDATIATMTAHIHRYRVYLVDRLRQTGRHELAERYHRAPVVGTLQELFGTDEPWAEIGETSRAGAGVKIASGAVAVDQPVGASS